MPLSPNRSVLAAYYQVAMVEKCLLISGTAVAALGGTALGMIID